MKSTKTSVAVVAVQSKLIGAIARPREGGPDSNGWPFPGNSSRNLNGEFCAEVVAVFVGDLDEGGALKLALQNPMTGSIGIAYANMVRIGRFEEGR